MTWRLCDSARRKRVAIFVSRTDHCLYDLLLRHRSGELVCEIPLIVSNHEELAPVAAQFGVPYRVFPISPETKPAQEAAQIALLEQDANRSRGARALHADPLLGVHRALSRTGSSTSTTRSCPRSAAGARISRRTSAA